MKTDLHLQQALTKSESLVHSTKRANVDQTITSLDLLAKVYNKKCDPINEVKCLSSIIQLNHSLLPDLWIRLGESYNCLHQRITKDNPKVSTENFAQFSIKPDYVICCCFVRALVLLKTVEATVISFASKANNTSQGYLNAEIEKLRSKNNISHEELNHIKCEMTKDIFNRYNTSNVKTTDPKEFVDLGSSKNQKVLPAHEDKMSQYLNVCQMCNITEFENTWFGFLTKESL